MLAHRLNKANVGPHGIGIDVATDPANQFKFEVPLPTVDYAAKAIDKAQDRYYDEHYTKKKIPVRTAGDMWSVKLKTD